MLRIVASRVASAMVPRVTATSLVGVQSTRASHGPKETDEEFDQRYVNFFNRNDIDHWEIRKAMNDLAGMDNVPEPVIICAALRACRRLNDFALAVRFLESVKDKTGPYIGEIYPYILQEIRPTLDELGISTPEELGYDKPELACQSEYHM
ncbi:Cytochrome c oxidase subunit 5A, mitochondrial [Camponotus floridanus]|uniref:Cytochrome c oxidase subunit 5A, mitochondrial n=1 Tax=Camponotus floridanus TaxID=104421 RepID=E2ACN8_CAMFO|nr:cytochrome c oxidase subunit 5A, mitochondrial [Camponotus floridanus]EFN68782.1 Cytochrome c oxidase subunit 5A, mitochondrial [Camponotus floridanus]